MSFNYNLIKTLKVLLDTKSIGESAIQLRTSSSSISRNLKSLRDIFNDELLTRNKGDMVLTPRAIELKDKIYFLINDMESLPSSVDFNPLKFSGKMNIAMNASIASWFASVVVHHLEKQAPNLQLTIEDWDDSTPQRINDSRVDYAIHYFPLDISKMFIQKLGLKDRFVLVCRKEHPLVGKNVGIADLQKYPLAIHTMKYWNENQNFLTKHLKKMGIELNIGFQTSHINVIEQILKTSDFLFPCSIHLSKNLSSELTYITSYDEIFEPLLHRNFGFLFNNSRRSDPFINWIHNEISELMKVTINKVKV